MLILFNVMALLGCATCALFAYELKLLIGGRGRSLIIASLVFQSLIRMLITYKDFFGNFLGIAWPVQQLSSLFYVLLALGIGILVAEVRAVQKKKNGGVKGILHRFFQRIR